MYVYENKLVFIAHPRTASRSTRDALHRAGAKLVAGHHLIDERRIKEVLDAGGIVACTKRNIFDVLVSWYHHLYINGKVFNGPSFTDWLGLLIEGTFQSENAKSQHLLSPLYHFGLQFANRMLRYERLQEDLNSILELLGIAPLGLTPVGVSQRDRNYQPYYTPETRAAVEQHWAEDFKLTGYQW